MASRCGNCGSRCTCTVTAGTNVTVTGTGSSTDPFVVNASGGTPTPDRLVGYMELTGFFPGALNPLMDDGFSDSWATASLTVSEVFVPGQHYEVRIIGDQAVLDNWTLRDVELMVHNADFSELMWLTGGSGEAITNNAPLNLGSVHRTFGSDLITVGSPITQITSSVSGMNKYMVSCTVALSHV